MIDHKISYYDNGKVEYEAYFINGGYHNDNGVIVKKQWYLYNIKIDGRSFNFILKNMPKDDLKNAIMKHYGV